MRQPTGHGRASHRAPFRGAAVGAALASAVACGACIAREESPARTLSLRHAAVPIDCDGERRQIGVVPGERIERYGFLQTVGSTCSFSLDVPEATGISLRVALRRPRSAGQVRVRVRAEVLAESAGEETSLLEEEITGARPVVAGRRLRKGPTTFRLRTRGVGAHSASRAAVEWTDIAFETRARGAPDPWPLPADEALAPFFADEPAGGGSGDGRRRLLVVGVDGASWARLDPLMAGGDLPNLAALKARGRYGVLAAPLVPESAISWTTLSTGVGPGGHGVFTFSSRPTPRRSVWHLLGDRGLRSIVLAYPKASIRRPIDGVMVAGWTVQGAQPFTQPAELRGPLLRAGYRPELRTLRNPDAFIEHMRLRTEIAVEFLARLDWDLAFVVYEYGDTAGHLLGLGTPEWARVQSGVDALLGRLVRSVDEETTLLVVSDHGWRRYPRRLSVGRWLRESGFSGLVATVPMSGNVVSIAPAPGAEPPDPETLARVREGLLELRDPRDGTRPVKRLVAPEAFFSGPYANASGVSLVVELDLRYWATLGGRAEPLFGAPRAHHGPEGVYLLAGRGIPAGPGPDASVADVAPTVLAFFGAAAPADWRGGALWDFGVRVAGGEAPQALYFEEPRPDASHELAVRPELERTLRLLGYIE